MKAVFFFLLLSFGLSAQIDTIYTDFTPVRQKKTTIKVTTTTGDEITEKREIIDYERALKKIERLSMDTTYYTENLKNLREMERNIEAEKKRIRMMRRDAIDVLTRLNNLLNTLK